MQTIIAVVVVWRLHVIAPMMPLCLALLWRKIQATLMEAAEAELLNQEISVPRNHGAIVMRRTIVQIWKRYALAKTAYWPTAAVAATLA